MTLFEMQTVIAGAATPRDLTKMQKSPSFTGTGGGGAEGKSEQN